MTAYSIPTIPARPTAPSASSPASRAATASPRSKPAPTTPPPDRPVRRRDRLHGRRAGAAVRLSRSPEMRARTAVAVVADHGESLTEHNYFFDHGLDVYQPSMRVPLLIRPPAAARGKRVAAAVQTIDIFSTLLGLAGWPIPGATEGRDLPGSCGTGHAFPGRGRVRRSLPAVGGGSAGRRPWRNDNKRSSPWPFPLEADRHALSPQERIVPPRQRSGGKTQHRRRPPANGRLAGRKNCSNWRRGAAAAQRPNPANLDKIRSLGYL